MLKDQLFVEISFLSKLSIIDNFLNNNTHFLLDMCFLI